MKRSVLALATASMLISAEAFAKCDDGPPFQCALNGKIGTRQCVGGILTPCIVSPKSPPAAVTATLAPKYLVLTLVYAPPGTTGGMSESQVVYGSGSSTGVSTSSTKAFKGNFSVSTTSGVGALGTGGSVGVSFSYTKNTSDAAAETITKSKTSTITDIGPASDGIDHDHDLIYLWLNPKVDVTISGGAASWGLDSSGTTDIQYVYVGWLKNPALMPPGVAQEMQAHGLTNADYATILQRDPFANGAGAVTSRFQPLNMTFPYEPPFAAGDKPPSTNFLLSNNGMSSDTVTDEDDYKVGLTVTAGVNFIVQSSLTLSDSWEWDNTSTFGQSAGTTQTASVTVGGPSFGYTGPTDIAVYYDRIYQTFMFQALAPGAAPRVKGLVTNQAGRPVANAEVTVTSHGVSYRSYTDARGEYRVFGDFAGPVTVHSGSTSLSIPKLAEGQSVDLKVKAEM